MQKFERIEKINMKYLKSEAEHQKKLADLFGIDYKCIKKSYIGKRRQRMTSEKNKSNTYHRIKFEYDKNVDMEEEKFLMGDLSNEGVCKGCSNELSAKGKLSCGHYICKDCLVNHLVTKFNLGRYYEYFVPCSICHEENKISKL